jgi:Tol biopolymer transport system component
LLVVSLLLSLVLACAEVWDASKESQEVIIYTTLRPSNQDIYLVDGPDAEPRRMTGHLGLDYNATFSPDGRWLVFTSERDGNVDLYALDRESDSDPVRLTRHPAMDDAADVSPDGDRIVFVSSRSGNADLFAMPFAPGDSTAEKEIVNLTQHPTGDFRPAFSPDGSSIAFSRQVSYADLQVQNPRFRGPLQKSVTQIYRMDADGSNPTRLVGETPVQLRAGHRASGSPAWTPDGAAMYYYTVALDSLAFGQTWTAQLRRVDPDGANAGAVTAFDTLLALSPTAGPNGRLFFYGGSPVPRGEQVSRETGSIYSVGADGSAPRREVDGPQLKACRTPAVAPSGRIACHGSGPIESLQLKADGNPLLRPGTEGPAELPDRTVERVGLHGYFPDFLPDGRVAYGESLPQTGYVDRYGIPPIVTSRLDGTNREVVLHTDSLGAWATSTCRTDGRIVFNTGPDFAPVDAPVDIWTIESDGTGLVNLTTDSTSNDAFPAFSADCEQIVFRSGRDGNKEIYLMNADGSNPRRLTNHPATDTAPHMSPDGEWVVFSTGRDRLPPDSAAALVPISRQGRGGGAGFRLWIQRIDGSEGRFLEPDLVGVRGRDMHPRFSPDGKWVLFISSRSGLGDEFLLANGPQPAGEVWAIPVEGGEAVRLTQDKWEDGLARWGCVP